MKQRPKRDVAVLVESTTAWGRDLIRGITRYAMQAKQWQLFTALSETLSESRLPTRWDGLGVIARVTPATYDKLKGLRCAVVNVSGTFGDSFHFPRVAVDYESAGRMAAEHLLDQGFRHFGVLGAPVPIAKVNGFMMAVRQRGLSCAVYDRPIVNVDDPQWRPQQRRLLAWLRGLPKPVGILGYNDVMGRTLINQCIRAGIPVPDEVAVIGMLNDEVICEMGTPPLSSVAVAAERQGYEAAALLDRLLSGAPAPPSPIFIEPIGVVPRQSTDTLAISDAAVSQAVRFIRDHADEGIRVEDVLKHVPISRRSLERRFAELLGRSPADEIRRVRLEEAKRLLRETELKGPAVAAAAGFSTQAYMITTFRRELRMTPADYRHMTRRC